MAPIAPVCFLEGHSDQPQVASGAGEFYLEKLPGYVTLAQPMLPPVLLLALISVA